MGVHAQKDRQTDRHTHTHTHTHWWWWWCGDRCGGGCGGLYCAYYVVKRHQGKTMKDIVKDFNVQQKRRNDRLIVTKMMKLCTRKRPVQRK